MKSMKMVAIKCGACGIVTSIDRWYAGATCCPKCGGQCNVIGEYVEPSASNKPITVAVKANGLDDIEKQLQRINKLVKETFAFR